MKAINVIKDEQKHKEVVDWWYFNGILKGKKSKSDKFAYMTCLFKVNPKEFPYIRELPNFVKRPINDVFFAHSVLTNLTTGETVKDLHKIVRVSEDSFTRPLLFIDYSPLSTKYSNYEIKEIHSFDYIVKTPEIDLELKSEKVPLLENNTGLFKYKNYYTYYYSLTSMKTSGLVKWKNRWIEVEGKSWHDHQWMNKIYNGEIWDWFSIQLDNNEEVVCARLKENNGKVWGYFATKIDKDGKLKTTKKVDFKPSKYWTSKETRLKYPTEWDITIKDFNMKIHAKAINKEQEMNFKFVKYWEGPVEYTEKTKKLKGQGFAELIGRKE